MNVRLKAKAKNEFMHIPTAVKLTECLAHVLHSHATR